MSGVVGVSLFKWGISYVRCVITWQPVKFHFSVPIQIEGGKKPSLPDRSNKPDRQSSGQNGKNSSSRPAPVIPERPDRSTSSISSSGSLRPAPKPEKSRSSNTISNSSSISERLSGPKPTGSKKPILVNLGELWCWISKWSEFLSKQKFCLVVSYVFNCLTWNKNFFDKIPKVTGHPDNFRCS